MEEADSGGAMTTPPQIKKKITSLCPNFFWK